MAWDEFSRDGVKGFSGDTPIDEFALALDKIVKAYEDRFKRKPTVAELMYALATVIGADPEEYVSDPQGLKHMNISVKRST